VCSLCSFLLQVLVDDVHEAWIWPVPQMWGHGQTWTLLSLPECLL
jgi:hypothetical protein